MRAQAKRRLILLVAGVVAGGLAASLPRLLRARASTRPAEPCLECRSKPPPRMPDPVPEDGFEKLRPPRPGEWRARFHEPEQTFEAYVKGCANRRCPHHAVFYIQPLETPFKRQSYVPGAHERHLRAIELMKEYAEIFFGVPVKVLAPIPMFEDTIDPDRDQCDATAAMNHLSERLPADALVYVGITEDDLFCEGLNFVFGQGSLSARTGIYSLRRLQTKDETLFLRRSLNLVSHEAGHIFSIEHCTVWNCVMDGANSLQESDAQPMHLCPADLRKLEWNSGFDRTDRYRKLLEFYKKHDLKKEADWVSKRLGF